MFHCYSALFIESIQETIILLDIFIVVFYLFVSKKMSRYVSVENDSFDQARVVQVHCFMGAVSGLPGKIFDILPRG